MLERFENIPDMLELDHLTVSGDVTFGKNVTLKVLYHVCTCTSMNVWLCVMHNNYEEMHTNFVQLKLYSTECFTLHFHH